MLELSEVATNNKRKTHSVWVVSTPFCAMQDINDMRYLPGYEDSRGRKRVSPRVTRVATRCVAGGPRADYRKQKKMHAITLRNIKFEKELFLDCSMRYLLSWLEVTSRYE